jgi:regulator of sirC expression with transglutaminase-like and TPR domain
VSRTFAALAAEPAAPVEELALAIAGEFRAVDEDAVRAELDELAAEVSSERRMGPEGDVRALQVVLGDRHGFHGEESGYDHPDNSMIDLVLERHRGLPILLSVVYLAVAGRAGIPLAGLGLPGHFVVGHVGADPPIVLDPFDGGRRIDVLRPTAPWSAHEIALRILNNLVGSYGRRGDLAGGIRAAELRLDLPTDGDEREQLADEALALRARLN